MEAITARLAPFTVHAPMTEPPYMDPPDIDAWMEREGLRRLNEKAKRLAELLIARLYQHSYLIWNSVETEWVTRRKND